MPLEKNPFCVCTPLIMIIHGREILAMVGKSVMPLHMVISVHGGKYTCKDQKVYVYVPEKELG
jgi:hypothetical protein